MYFCCIVKYHMHLVWLIIFCCIHLFERLEEFCFLRSKMFQKVLRIICELHLLVCLLVCVLRLCYRFLSIMRSKIQKN